MRLTLNQLKSIIKEEVARASVAPRRSRRGLTEAAMTGMSFQAAARMFPDLGPAAEDLQGEGLDGLTDFQAFPADTSLEEMEMAGCEIPPDDYDDGNLLTASDGQEYWLFARDGGECVFVNTMVNLAFGR